MNRWYYEEETKTVRQIPENYCVAALGIDAACHADKDGKLIAAAPDLLEAWKQLLIAQTAEELDVAYLAGEKAVAKAEGPICQQLGYKGCSACKNLSPAGNQ